MLSLRGDERACSYLEISENSGDRGNYQITSPSVGNTTDIPKNLPYNGENLVLQPDNRLNSFPKELDMNPELTKLNQEKIGLKVFPLFALTGWALIGVAILIRAVVLAPTGAAYWGENPKAVRDAADVGSALLGQLTTLAWWPMLLEPLIFLGVAAFMVGIALLFSAIPGILDRRIEGLKKALPLMGRQ
jgi:hypothetical protein